MSNVIPIRPVTVRATHDGVTITGLGEPGSSRDSAYIVASRKAAAVTRHTIDQREFARALAAALRDIGGVPTVLVVDDAAPVRL